MLSQEYVYAVGNTFIIINWSVDVTGKDVNSNKSWKRYDTGVMVDR